MTPNSQTINKLSQIEAKTEDIIDSLKKLVLEENKTISYTYVSLRFGVHVKKAIQVLDKFVTEERSDGKNLSLNYLLSGNNDTSDDNEIKMERFMIVNESEMESSTDWFKNGFKKQIYSVSFEDKDLIDLNFDEYDYQMNDKNDLNVLHNLRYVKNPNIEFRKVCRRVGIKPVIHKNEDKTEEKKSNANKETENKSKQKTNSKTKNKKKSNISKMFSKTKEIKVENNEEKVDDKESDDPFGSESEDDNKEHKVEKSEPSMNGNSDEEEEKTFEPIVKNKHKRHSKNDSNTEDEEEVISSKKKNKKYKRIRLISDTDSDDTKEETVLDKFVSNKKTKEDSKPIKSIKEVKETHLDEDGYVVTKTVKKEVQNKESEDKNEDKIEDKIIEKSKQNPKKIEKKAEKKPPPKTSKDTKSKTQSSITSFFKPKQIST